MRASVRFLFLVPILGLAAGCGEDAAEPKLAPTASSNVAISQDFYQQWTVSKWKHLPPGMKKTEHILEGESFEIVQVSGNAVIRPNGSLIQRWGFEERTLNAYDEHLCVSVDLPHGQQGVHKEHLVTFMLARDEQNIPDPHGLDIRFPHSASGLSCQNAQIHGGTAHAEN